MPIRRKPDIVVYSSPAMPIRCLATEGAVECRPLRQSDSPVKFRDFSPRLLFHIIRCYIMLPSNEKGCVVVQRISVALTNGSLCDIIEEIPIIGGLLSQLLIYVNKVTAETLRRIGLHMLL
ncbi:hypothetical protein KSP40_PGU013682 [Platanthera guangdongensis]|uniref:Uncharacterized protein n=1 Tax=Platanthera guangdongensis TaxID=2320717 RepID=A0ABR2N4Y7_9ASPA